MKSGLQLIPSPNNKKKGRSVFPTNPFSPHLPLEASRGADSEQLRARLCLGIAPAPPHMLCVKAGEIQTRGRWDHRHSSRTEPGSWSLQVSPRPLFLQELTLWKRHSQTRGLSPPLVWSIYTFRGRICVVWGVLWTQPRPGSPWQGCYDSTVRLTIRPSLSMAKL